MTWVVLILVVFVAGFWLGAEWARTAWKLDRRDWEL